MQQIGKIELERKGNELELAINWGFWWWKISKPDRKEMR